MNNKVKTNNQRIKGNKALRNKQTNEWRKQREEKSWVKLNNLKLTQYIFIDNSQTERHYGFIMREYWRRKRR